MAIQVRRGANDDFDSSKMLPGELAVTTDGSRKVYVAFKAGDVKEMASKEEVQEIVDEFDKNVEQEIEDAKNAVIEEAEEQVQKVINKAYEVLESIPDDYEELAKQSDEAVRTKADAILCTASGKSIVVKDSSNDYVRQLKSYGKTKQRITTGKNKLPYPYNGTTKTEAGITFTDNGDGTITANGTATGNVYFYCIVSSSHYMDGKLSLLPTVSGVDIGIRTTDNTYVIGNGNEYSGYINQLFIRILRGTTVSNIVLKPMIVSNETTDYDWEPYTGGLPSPSMEYPQELENVGEWGNLYDENTYPMSEGWVSLPNGEIRTDENYKCTESYIPFSQHAGKTIILNHIPNGTYPGMAFYDENQTFISGGKGTAIVVPENTAYMRFTVNVTDTDIMLNYGTTALPYRPYSGQMELESGVLGKNLLNLADKTTSNAVHVYEKVAVNIQKGTYYFSCKHNLATGLGWWVSFYNVNGTSIGHTGILGSAITGKEITLSEDAVSVSIYFNGAVTISEIQLEKGTVRTDYEPYTRQSHINLLGNGLPGIPLGQTIPDIIKNSPIHMAGVYLDEEDGQYWIGDTVDNESGVLVQRTIHESFVKNNIVKSSDGKYFFINAKAKLVACGFCNIASYAQGGFNFGQFWIADSRYIIGNLDDNGNEIYSTVNEFYEAVGREVEFLGIIETPIETPLTAGEIASYRALRSNYHVTTVVNDCDCHEEFSYNADTKCYIDNKFAELAEKLLA